ncbi:MAG TPA: hypothetical protein DEB09_03765 [Candidatus Magasanikbacteria bacterium]|nr:hypothetical protein [Candidatus Magasanikbacteria bacterium]
MKEADMAIVTIRLYRKNGKRGVEVIKKKHYPRLQRSLTRYMASVDGEHLARSWNTAGLAEVDGEWFVTVDGDGKASMPEKLRSHLWIYYGFNRFLARIYKGLTSDDEHLPAFRPS